jgi:aspartyl/asparaginyl beta-hydroxylase (cupin superfamily)
MNAKDRMEKPNLDSASFKFSQEGNTNGTTSEYEDLNISLESSLRLDFEGDGFYILRTEGWSIDGVEDLQELFDRIKKIMLDKK